jgi:hypothetical protein
MTASRVNGLSALLLALLVAAALPARAQDDIGAPVQLPGASEDEPAATTDETIPQTVPSRPGARDLGIEVGVISSRAPTVGTLSGADGLGSEIWAGTSTTQAQILLNQIPVGAPSRAMGNLVRRLLLTATRPPADARGGDQIIELRLARALDAGLINAVPTLIDQATQLEGDPDIQILRAETILLRGGGMEACSNATSQRMESEVPFWMKLRAYCFANQGLVPAARLTADLLYDTGDEDELFQALLERMTGNETISLDGLLDQPLGAIHLALMRDINIVPPVSRMDAQSLSIVRIMALDPGWYGEDGLAFRLQAGEAAALAGALSSADLLGVYRDVAPFERDRRTEQLTAAARTNTANARALFAEALTVDTIPGTRAETLSAALSPAAATDMGLPYAAALGRAVRDMRPEEVLAWASHSFAIVTIADGDLAQAYDWFDIYSRSGKPDSSRIQSLHAALAMAAPSERFAFWPDHALRWLEQADLGDYPHHRLTAQLMWFESMGYAVPVEVRERLSIYENDLVGTPPPPAVMGNLREAALAGRIGETVGYALVAIGPGGPRSAHPAALAEAIRALREVGLADDARALAAEAMLGFALEDVE